MFFLKRYKNLRFFKPYFTKYTPLIAALICVMVIASTMGMVLAYLMSEQMVGITNQIISQMVQFTILIIAAVLIHHISWFLWNRFEYVLGGRIAKNIRADIISKTLNTKYLTVKENTSGYYLERLNDDTNEVSMFLPNVAGTLTDVLTNCSFLVLIYFLNWQCGLFFTIGITLLLIIDLIKVKKDLIYLTKVKKTTEKSNSNLSEIIRGMKDIKGLGIKEQVAEKSGILHENLRATTLGKNTTYTLLSRIKTFLQWLIDACLVFACAFWLFPTGQITVVALLIIFNYKSLMYDTVGFFSKIKSYYVQGDFQAGRILEVINTPQTESFGGQDITFECGGIEVKNLSFSYDGCKNILEDVSFKADAGTCSVLVGASGSGKSTLFGLLSKLLNTENGRIFLGGRDINEFSEQSFRADVCIINQEPFIFNDTVLNNIKIVKPDAAADEVTNACKKANIHNEILSFADGYDTELNENGANLSGGQKQRIAIARAILKNTPIILFDEPTSALDKENQALFLELLAELKKEKTIFVIAHKLNSYDVFDNIFTLKNGKIE